MASELTTQERLLVAQAVHEVGAGDWDRVSSLLDPHPLCSNRAAGYWSAQEAYNELMAESKIESRSRSLEVRAPCITRLTVTAKEHLKLARVYYFARVAELRAAIFSGIEDFKRIVNDIQDIKAGKWDDRLPAAPDAESGRRTRDSTREDAEIAAELVPPPAAAEEADTSAAIDVDEPEAEEAETGAEADADADTKTRKSKKAAPAGRRKGRRSAAAADEVQVKPEEDDELPKVAESAVADESIDASEDAGGEDEEAPATTKRGGRRSNPKGRKRKRTESTEPSAVRPSASPELDMKRARIEESVDEDEDPEEKRARDLRFRKSMQLVHDQIISDGRSTFFRNPVRRADAPAYHDAIKRPMDLKTVGTRLRTGIITSTAAYRRDVMNIFANAVIFNNPATGGDLVKEALEMAQVAEEAIAAYEAIEARD